MTGPREYKKITVSEKGDMFVFLMKPESERPFEDFSLCLWKSQGKAREIINNKTQGMPKNWRISENGKISFASNGKSVFFGIAPPRRERDPYILEDEFPCVDIWHGGEGELHTVQLANRDRELLTFA